MVLKKLMEHISIIPDYRQAWKVEHKLSDILLLTICAVISGAEGWEDIEDFGETHLDFLKQYGDFENGIPVSRRLPDKALPQGASRSRFPRYKTPDHWFRPSALPVPGIKHQ